MSSNAAAALASPAPRGLVLRGYQRDYAELKRLVKEKGLLDKHVGYYVPTLLITLILYAAGLAFLAFADALWMQLTDAVFLACVFAQVAFLGHDAGHRQVCRTPRNNDVIGLGVTLLLGISRSWWVDAHNRHHGHPNQLGVDPDVELPVLAFSEDQALSKRGLFRFVVRYQAQLFFPLLMLEALSLRLASAQFLMRGNVKYAGVERTFFVAHGVAYGGLLVFLLGGWAALPFIAVHQALTGFYLALLFAPNHKGMPILEQHQRMDFFRQQVLTARNITSHPLTDYFFGGQNFQIEHHLFPSMPRRNFRRAQKIVKAFCEARSIAYRENSPVGCAREILAYLHQVSAPLRA